MTVVRQIVLILLACAAISLATGEVRAAGNDTVAHPAVAEGLAPHAANTAFPASLTRPTSYFACNKHMISSVRSTCNGSHVLFVLAAETGHGRAATAAPEAPYRSLKPFLPTRLLDPPRSI